VFIAALTSCARLHRANWTSTELFLTFPPPKLTAISLLPLNSDETAGRFRIWLYLSDEPPILLWDRKVEGGFPELKVLVGVIVVVVLLLCSYPFVTQKQRLRDHIQPGVSLGHSDTKK